MRLLNSISIGPCTPVIRQSRRHAFTLVDVVISLGLVAIAVSCLVAGYFFSASSLEQSGYSLAANALTLERIEQTRAAKWDMVASPPVDELIPENFPPEVRVLDMPRSGVKAVYATNNTRIWMVATNPPLKAVRVDTTWSLLNRETRTNTVIMYRRSN